MTARPARWRCSDPTCPAYTWQPVIGDGDPLVLARKAIDRHLAQVHGDDDTHAYADTEVNR